MFSKFSKELLIFPVSTDVIFSLIFIDHVACLSDETRLTCFPCVGSHLTNFMDSRTYKSRFKQICKRACLSSQTLKFGFKTLKHTDDVAVA